MKTRLLSLLLVILAFVMPMKLWAAESNAEPYAVLSENNTKLTFYYDDQREARGGMSVAGSFDHPNYQPWYSQRESITSAEFDPSFANCTTLTSTAYWFLECKNMVSISGIEYLKTDNVTDMWGMFGGCSGLTSLDLSGFNTANVKSMGSMFEGCSGLTKIFAGDDWNTALVTDGGSMFSGCTSLVGGAGTAYDANHTDHTYAHIDGGTANPGYFTAKDGQTDDDPLLARLYDNLALTTTDGNAEGGNNDLGGSIDAAQTSLVRAMWNLQELPTDESYCVWMDAGIPVLNTNTWSNSTQTDAMKGLYARLYHGIILANNYLANQHDGDLGKQAEARFLRALQYYYLMDHFGNVPLLTDTIDRQPLPVWEATPSDIELLTREEMFSYIENELQESLNSLPATNSYGRATATAARLLLARLYLNSEVYTGTARWQEARSYAESVINGGTFQLAPIYRNLFMGDNDSNGAQQEIILPAIYDGNTRTDYGGTTFLVASSFTNGEGDNGTTQVWAGNVSKPDFVNKFFTQTADIPYASPEQTASAAGDDRALFYGINHSYELRNGDSFSDGFPYQKFTNVRSNGTSPVSSKFADTDFPLMRLGEAYLIAAEADARLNGSATSMQGTQYINMLRNRANAAASTAGYSLSDICDEWSREMGYEAVRRTTLIRFGRFGGQADYSWAWKGGSYDGSAFDAAKNTYPIPAVAVGGTPEPYAVLSDNNTKLTFFYDDQKAIRDGMRVGPFGSSSDVPWYSERESITSAEFDSSFADCTTLTSTVYWFYECKNMVSISGIEYLKTDNVTNMYCMFYGCSGLTSLDVSGFNTENVTTMEGMFLNCSGLTSLDVSHFNTANVTDMYGMFGNCSGLTSLDVSGFNTANVTDMYGMFAGCSGLTSLDVSGFNTANVTDMSWMFADCSSLTSIDVSGFNTANVTDMYGMFYGCSGLTTLDVSHFNTTNVMVMGDMFWECSSLETLNVGGFNTSNVWDFGGMFGYCSSLKSLDISNFDTSSSTWMRRMFAGCSSMTNLDVSKLKTENVTNMLGMFEYCSNLTTLDVSHFNTEKVTEMGEMFYECSALTSLDVSHFNTANVTNMWGMFNDCSSLTTLDVSHFDTKNVTSMTRMFDNCKLLTNLDVSHFNTDSLTALGGMFRGCSSLTNLEVNSFNTSNVLYMWSMFQDCTSLTSLDLGGFNTGNVIEIQKMFAGCSSLTSLDVSHFDTKNVTSMSRMFQGCTNLTSLELSGFNTANVTDMSGMFVGCSNLKILNLSLFNTQNVTNMNGMFLGCSGLTNLDISGFNTANVTNMNSMFGLCGSLTTLDLSNFNTAKVKDMQNMFRQSQQLKTIYVGDGWSTASVEKGDSIFYQCTSLIGGAGTVYDANHTDYTYAHIDGGASNPGYFTDKNAAPVATAEPYAVLSDNNTLLTFFYDDQKAARGGMSVGPFGYYEDVPWYSQRESITFAEFDPSFANCTTLTSTTKWFYGCWNMVSISGIQYLKTDNVTDMSSMFERCFNLTSLDLSNFNTENVTDMHSMFDSCSRLASLNVSSFNTNKVTNMGLMFSACYELTSLDVSGFNTDNVTDMHGMFGGSSGLTSLDLSNFKTDKVTTMFLMFEGCSGLTSLDLSSFNTENVTKFSNMFKDCSNLKTIYVGNDWNTSKAEEGAGMFLNCTSLVGGAGTIFNANHVDYTYAHIDGGASNPGYFTDKNAPEGEATFDGLVARVSGERTLDEAFEQRGGRAEAEKTIAAIVWNKETALSGNDLQGITNPNLLVYVNDASLAPSNVQNVVVNGLAKEIVLTDVTDGNNNWYAPQAFVAERISYSRLFSQTTQKGVSRGWESIALPFDVQTIQHETKGVIAPFNNSASNKHFWLRRLTENGLQPVTGIEANTPYVISMPNSEEYTDDYNLNGRVTFSAQNIDVPATTAKVLALADSSIVMVPAMQRQSRSSAVWALNVGEVRGQYFEGSVFERDYRTVRPFEAYTIHRQENGQPAPRYVPIQEIAGVTGIETIDREPLTLNQWYDMQGRKLEGKPARKGVYISNGKKVVVK